MINPWTDLEQDIKEDIEWANDRVAYWKESRRNWRIAFGIVAFVTSVFAFVFGFEVAGGKIHLGLVLALIFILISCFVARKGEGISIKANRNMVDFINRHSEFLKVAIDRKNRFDEDNQQRQT